MAGLGLVAESVLSGGEASGCVVHLKLTGGSEGSVQMFKYADDKDVTLLPDHKSVLLLIPPPPPSSPAILTRPPPSPPPGRPSLGPAPVTLLSFILLCYANRPTAQHDNVR